MDTLNLRDFLTVLQSHGQNCADECAARVAVYAPVGMRDYATVLRDSIHGQVEPTADGMTVTVIADPPSGTYPIDPVNKKALMWPGADHPVRHVEHPFSVPSDLGEKAQVDVQAVADETVQAALDEWGAA